MPATRPGSAGRNRGHPDDAPLRVAAQECVAHMRKCAGMSLDEAHTAGGLEPSTCSEYGLAL